MRTASWTVLAGAALSLMLGCAGDGAMPRPARGTASSTSPSAVASSSTPLGLRPAGGAGSAQAAISRRELNEVLAAKLRAIGAASRREPTHWPLPFRLTTRAGRSRQAPRERVVDIALGAGFGCAELDATGERYRACWLPSSVAEQERGKRPVRAKRVPWLGVWPTTAANRLCARVGTDISCWPAPQLLRERPVDMPEPRAWRRAGRATQYSVAIAAAPSFVCAIDGGALVCHGSDPFGVLALSPVTENDLSGWPYPLALGHHHGCVRQGLDIACWGRGDHGELGYAPSERCQDGAGEVACSHQLGLVRLQGERSSHPPLLAAGDAYTCAVTANFVECWGQSRDGFFAAPGPSRVPGLRLNGVNSLSAGPRGLCGDDYAGGAVCAGAIPAPPHGVSHVVVSRGDDASARGVDAEGIVCWGEAYSSRGRPRVPVRIRIDPAVDIAAPVIEFPGRWDRDCQIKRPCTRDWAKPPRCDGTPPAVPWAALAPNAAAQRGNLVRVMGNFVVGPVSSSLMGCSRAGPGQSRAEAPNAPALCCNGSWAPLGLVSDDFALRLEDLECEGDESRLCCSAAANGQAIVATGTLEWQDERGESGWMLREPKLCSLE